MTDPELLRACLAGEAGAWEAFVARFAPYLAETCRRTLRRRALPAGPSEAEEMLQSVFVELLSGDARALRRWRGEGRLASYLAAVAVCRVLDDRTLARGGVELPPDLEPAQGAASPPEVLEAEEALASLGRELERLPARQRLALRMQAEGASLKTVAGALGMTPEAAGQMLSRAKRQLRDRLGHPRES